jgi:hypothetical protein
MRKTTLVLLLAMTVAGAARTELANPELLDRLSDSARAVLDREGLVALPSEMEQFSEMYKKIADDALPMLITTDPLLHAGHVLFDRTLYSAELSSFRPALLELLSGMLAHERLQLQGRLDKNVREALLANVAFLSVPLVCLDTGFVIPPEVKPAVEAELALMRAHSGFAQSAVTGLKEDFSQYVPRGHYTRNERLESYFLAMMYVGRMSLPLRPAEKPELGVKLTRMALLLSEALQEGLTPSGGRAEEAWRRIYEPTSYLVGAADDLVPADYLGLARRTRGAKRVSSWAGPDAAVKAFIAAAESLPAPGILSGFLSDLDGPVAGTKSMRLLGQRFIPDAYMFQQLVYDKVGTRENPRTMPMGLDVMAVLGADRAREHLKSLYHQDKYDNYEKQLDALRTRFSRLSPGDWNQTAYLAWLRALKLNLESLPAVEARVRLARFCTTTAYADKTLVTSSASWAELRHDTILYAKQSYTMFATAVPPRPPKGQLPVYVEPKPEVFDQLARLAQDLQARLAGTGLQSPELSAKLGQLSTMCLQLADMARAELSGQELAPDRIRMCAELGRWLSDLPTFMSQPADSGVAPAEEDRSIALVADVHTDPNSAHVLEEAVDKPCWVYAVIPFKGREYLAAGGCFSYYEFTRPMSGRLTDKDWQELKDKPAMPEWTRSFIMQQGDK